MADPLIPQADPFDAWVDRLGNIEFIEDQKSDNGLLQRDYYRAACNLGFWAWML